MGYASANRGKRSIALDLSRKEGIKVLKEYGFTEADIHELEKSNIISEN